MMKGINNYREDRRWLQPYVYNVFVLYVVNEYHL